MYYHLPLGSRGCKETFLSTWLSPIGRILNLASLEAFCYRCFFSGNIIMASKYFLIKWPANQPFFLYFLPRFLLASMLLSALPVTSSMAGSSHARSRGKNNALSKFHPSKLSL